MKTLKELLEEGYVQSWHYPAGWTDKDAKAEYIIIIHHDSLGKVSISGQGHTEEECMNNLQDKLDMHYRRTGQYIEQAEEKTKTTILKEVYEQLGVFVVEVETVKDNFDLSGIPSFNEWCPNGCPEPGHHKFSCSLAGQEEYRHASDTQDAPGEEPEEECG